MPMYSDVAESSFVVGVCGVSVRAYRARQGISALRTWVQLCMTAETGSPQPQNLCMEQCRSGAESRLGLQVGETVGRCLSRALGIEPHWAEGNGGGRLVLRSLRLAEMAP